MQLSFKVVLEPYGVALFQWLNIARLYLNETCRDIEPYLLILATVLSTYLLISLKNFFARVSRTDTSLLQRIKSASFKFLINIPFVKGFARKKLGETVSKIVCIDLFLNFAMSDEINSK